MDKKQIIEKIAIALSLLMIIFHLIFWFSHPGITPTEGVSLSISFKIAFPFSFFYFLLVKLFAIFFSFYSLRILSLLSLIAIFFLLYFKKKNPVKPLIFLAVILSIPQINQYIKVFSPVHLGILFFFLFDIIKNKYVRGIIAVFSPFISPFLPFFLLFIRANKIYKIIGAGLNIVFIGIFYKNLFFDLSLLKLQSLYLTGIFIPLLFILIFIENKNLKSLLILFLLSFILFFLNNSYELPFSLSFFILLYGFYRFDHKKWVYCLFLVLAVFNLVGGFVNNFHLKYQFDYSKRRYIKLPFPSVNFQDIKDLPELKEPTIISRELAFLKKDNWKEFDSVIENGKSAGYKYLLFDDFLKLLLKTHPSKFLSLSSWREKKRFDSIILFYNPNYFLAEIADFINERIVDQVVITDPSIYGLIKGNVISINTFVSEEKNSNLLMKTKFLFIKDYLLDNPSAKSVFTSVKSRLEFGNWKKIYQKNGYTLFQNPAMR